MNHKQKSDDANQQGSPNINLKQLPQLSPLAVSHQHQNNTTLLDSAASTLLLHAHAPSHWAHKQLTPKYLTIPNGQTITVTEMLTLQLSNLPTAHRVPHI